MVDSVARVLTSRLPMRRRIVAAKRYNRIRWGRFEQERRRVYWRERATRPETWKATPRLDDGYAIDDSGSLPHLDQAIADCREILQNGRLLSDSRKSFLANQLLPEDLEHYPALLAFATSPRIVAVVSEYLDMIPVLSTLEFWRSDGEGGTAPISSQLYHLDNADLSQVKVFVAVDDVTAGSGPLTFLPLTASRHVCDVLDYGRIVGVHRLGDEEVFDVIPRESSEVVGACGRGTVLFLDTVQCLHYGSRNVTRPRHMLVLQYLSPCRADFRPTTMKPFLRDSDGGWRRLILDPSFLPSPEHRFIYGGLHDECEVRTRAT